MKMSGAEQKDSPDAGAVLTPRLTPIGVFWDIENCPVPSKKSPLAVVQRIRSRFFEGHIEVEFLCVCDARKENATVTQELNDAQVTVVHINATSKNAADDKLRQCLRRFANAYSPPATLILISGDVNFAGDLSDLRHRQKFHILLVHPDNAVSEALKACAHKTYPFSELTADVSPRIKKKAANDHELLVRGLPYDRAVGLLKMRLRQLSDNCGGKVVNVNKTTALLKFPSAEDAARALKRLEGEDVFGRKIHVEAASGLHRVPVNKPPQLEEGKNIAGKSKVEGVLTGAKSRCIEAVRGRGTFGRCKSLGPDGIDDRCKEGAVAKCKRQASADSRCYHVVDGAERRPSTPGLNSGRGKQQTGANSRCSTPFSRQTSANSRCNTPFSRQTSANSRSSTPGPHSHSNGGYTQASANSRCNTPAPATIASTYPTSTDSRSSTPGPVMNTTPKPKKRRNRSKAKKRNNKNTAATSATAAPPIDQDVRPKTSGADSGHGTTDDIQKQTSESGRRSVSEPSPRAKRKRRRRAAKLERVGGDGRDKELEEPLVVLAAGSGDSNSYKAPAYSNPSPRMYSTSPHTYGSSPRMYGTSPRAYNNRSPNSYHSYPQQYGYNLKGYGSHFNAVPPEPMSGYMSDQPISTEPTDPGYIQIDPGRARNVAFQPENNSYYSSNTYRGAGGYNSPVPRRYGSSPRGGAGCSSFGHLSPKFRRTPGASRPNSCGPTFPSFEVQLPSVNSRCAMGGQGGGGGQQLQQPVQQQQQGGSTGNGRHTPAMSSRSSSSCSNNPPPSLPPSTPVPGQHFFQPIRTPPSPLMGPHGAGGGVSGSDFDFDDDMENDDEDIELMVSNLDYNISAREWKKILFTEFQQQVQVLGVYIQTQADNTNIGFIRVASIDEARYAISQFHRKKIGYKRIHVALVNHDIGASLINTKSEVQALLREVTGGRLPLFKFIELFEKRYHRSISVSELYRLKDTIDIQGDDGTGRMVVLHQALAVSPVSSAGSTTGSQMDQPVEEFLESPVCRQHCKEGSINYMDALDLCCLPNVVLLLKSFAPQVHTLLQLHDGCMPIMSFPACYAAEFSELKTTTKGGVPLEHVVSCVPGVTVVVTKSGIKKVQWAENKIPAQLLEFGRFCSSPLMNQQLGQFSREVVDLLKTCAQCKMTFSKFIPNYHHHFGRQCRVADYGYTKLMELFEAIPHVVQILGGGSRRFVTLSHRAQVKRFTSDILRVLKSQASKQINITDMPIVYNKVIGKPFDITDYGVCYIEDMLEEMPESTVVVTGVGDKMNLAIPRREQTSAEIERTRQFSLEVIDLLKHSPQCRMPFNKFIPSYHHHFGKQCRVSDYGFTKLIELFESIPNIVLLIDEQDEKILALTETELVNVLEEQVTSLLRAWPNHTLPMPEFLAAYMKQFGHSLRLQDFGVSSVPELIEKIPSTAKIETHDSKSVITLVDHSYVEQLARRVLLVLMDVDSGQMTVADLDAAHTSMFGFKLNMKELCEELQGVVQVSSSSEDGIVKLCALQQFARDARTLLRKHQGKLSLNSLELAYAEHFGVALVPASYGYPSVAALLQAIPHVANIRGKGYRRTVLLCQDFQGKMNVGATSPVSSDISEMRETKANTPSNDSGITEPSHVEDPECSDHHMLLTSAGGRGSPYDLLTGVPSTVPSPDLQPQQLDLMRFEPTPPPCDVLTGLTAAEKHGQSTPLCKTPVSEMLQFAAQLLPNNPPVLPPSATHVDILQNQLQAGLGISQGAPSYQNAAAMYAPQGYQHEAYQQESYTQYEYATYQNPEMQCSYEDYGMQDPYMHQQQQHQQQQQQHQHQQQYPAMPAAMSAAVSLEYQFPAPPLPDTSYPPPLPPDVVYSQHQAYQQCYPTPMMPPPPYPERHCHPGTPGTPNTSSMSVLGKQMAELVLETPATVEQATPMATKMSGKSHSPNPLSVNQTIAPMMQLEGQGYQGTDVTTPVASTSKATACDSSQQPKLSLQPMQQQQHHQQQADLKPSASASNLPSQISKLSQPETASLPSSPFRSAKNLQSGNLSKWHSEGTDVHQLPAAKSDSTEPTEPSVTASPLPSRVHPRESPQSTTSSMQSPGGPRGSPMSGGGSPSPRKCRIAAKFNNPITESPPRSDTSSNY